LDGIKVFMVIAKFPVDVTVDEFIPLANYLSERGYEAFYDPELCFWSLSLKFEDATVSLQNKRGVMWVKDYGKVEEIATRACGLIAEYRGATGADARAVVA
jgi:hypothetical protein